MDKKEYYVCWMSINAGIQHGEFEIEGKVNSLSVMKAVNDKFYMIKLCLNHLTIQNIILALELHISQMK